MKRVFVLLLCLVLAMGVLASCTTTPGGSGDGHTHTFETEWSHDSEGHWYDATCDCEDLEPTKLAHVDANNDGACDLCTEASCSHTYETETWTVNCEQHWRAATCGHVVVGIEAADHADENADGKCDACNYIIEDIHVHVYDDEWTSDETDHWHAALCEHKIEVADKAAHELDAAGYCTVCEAKVNEVDMTDFLAVLTAAVARNHKVVDASVIEQQLVYGGTNGNYVIESQVTNDVYFVLGNGYSYIFNKTFDANGFVGADEYWFEQISDSEVFGVSKRYGDYQLTPATGAMQFLNGYNYVPGSILPSANDDTSTLANLLYLLYGRATATDGKTANFVKEYKAETGEYYFGFTCYNINIVPASGSDSELIEVELYNAAVMFTVDENLVVDNAVISVEVYRDFEADRDLSYDVGKDLEGNTVVTNIQLSAAANPSFYNYVVSQRSGERTFTTPYPRASLIPQSFDFSIVTDYTFDENSKYVILDEAPVGDSLTVQEGAYLTLHVGNPKPVTASFDFMTSSDFSYSFVNKDANSTAVAWDNVLDSVVNGYSSYSNCLKIKIREPGEYTVTIKFGDLVKVFDLIVEGEKEPELGDDDANTVNVATTDTYGWFDLYSYTAAEAGTYTFTLPAGLGLQSKASYDAWGQPEVDFYSNAAGGATVQVALNAGEKYEFYVAATTKGTWVINVSFAAGEGSGDDDGGSDEPIVLPEKDLIIGNNSINQLSAAYVYTAPSAGKLTITTGGAVSGSVAYSYSINGAEAIDLALNSSIELTLVAGDKVTVNVVATGYSSLLAAWVGDDEGGEDVGGGDEGGDDDTTLSGSGTEEDPFVLNGIPADVTANPDASNYTFYKFTATEEGILTITYTNANSWVMVRCVEDPQYYESGYQEQALTFEIVAGNTYIIGLGVWEEETAPAAVAITFSAQDLPDEGEFEKPIEFNDYSSNPFVCAYPGGNDANLFVWYKYTSYKNGTITLTLGGNAVVLYGSDANSLSSSIGEATVTFEVSAYESYYIAIQSYSLAAEDISVSFFVEEAVGSSDNPIVIEDYTAEQNCESLPNGEFTYYSFFVFEDGYVTVSSSYLNALINGGTDTWDMASNYGEGELKFFAAAYSTVYIAIADGTYGTESVSIPFSISFEAGERQADGSTDAPYTAVMGDNVCNYVENANAVWYSGVAANGGYLTVSSSTANALISLGLDIYDTVNNDLGYDYATQTANLAESVTIYVPAGAIYYISITDYNYLASEITFTVSFEEKASESFEHLVGTWTATEENWDGSLLTYTLTITADDYGTYADAYDSVYFINYIFVDGETVIIGTQGDYSTMVMNMTYADSALTYAPYSWSPAMVFTQSGAEGGDDDGGDDPVVDAGITGDGSEANPYVVAGEGSVVIAASGWNPLFVMVNAGVTATIDSGAQFYTDITDPSATAGTTVCPEVDTMYYIFADSGAGATCMLSATGGSSEGGDEPVVDAGITGDGSEANPYVVAGEGSVVIAASGWNPLFVMVNAGVTATIDSGAQFYTDITDPSATAGTTVCPEVDTMYYIFADSGAGATCMLSATVGGSSEGGDEPVVGADGTFANPYELGETNAVDFPGGMDYVFYAYTATAAGTLTINITTTDYYWAYGFDEYSLTTVGGYNPTADIAIAAGQTVYVGLSTYSCNAKAITFTSSFVASGEDVGGGETSEPDGTFANPYELGETNAVDFPGGMDYVFYAYTATAAGTLTINVTSDDFYWAYGAGEYALENVGNVASAGITLAAGETVYIGMSSYSYGAAIITFTATFSEGGSSEGGDEGGEDVGGGEVGGGETSDLAGSGTSADPWVLVTLPYSATHGAGHDVYYSYTATEAVTIVISYPAGSVISGLPSSYVKDETAMTYTFSLAAGETVIINPWTTGVLEAYNYTFAIGEPTTDEGGETPDVGGGESAAVTYIGSTTSNNRKMMVVIDAAAGTMTVTRSDMTGNFTGGATTANFTYSFADGVVTYEVVGSSSVTAMTFDENGAPLTVTWMGVVYEGYELQ